MGSVMRSFLCGCGVLVLEVCCCLGGAKCGVVGLSPWGGGGGLLQCLGGWPWWSCLWVPSRVPRSPAWREASASTVLSVCGMLVVGPRSGRCHGGCPLVLQCSSGCYECGGHWLGVLRWWRRGLFLWFRGACSREWDGWSEGPFVCVMLPPCARRLPVSCCQPRFPWPGLC